MTVPAATRPARATGWGEWVPLLLVALVLIPAVSGSLRLVEVFGGPHLMPANPRIAASPLPVVVHIMCAVPYAVLGAFQLSSSFRRRRPRWHRASGRVVVGLGLSAIRRGEVARHRAWMTRAYALALGAGTQAFTPGIGGAAFGTSELATDLSLGAGWGINLALAEYVIGRRGSDRTTRRALIRATANVGSS